MTDELSRDEAKDWIKRNWNTMTKKRRAEVLKRYWKKYGGTKTENPKAVEEEPEIIKKAREEFKDYIPNK